MSTISAVTRGPGIVLALGLLLGGGPARSQGSLEPQDELAAELQGALRLLNQGRLDEALVRLESLTLRTDPPPQLAATLGALYLEASRPREALATLEPLAEDEAADPAVLYNTGRAALALGEPERAALYWQRSIDRVPISPASRELGLLRGRQGKIFEAYRLLRPWATQTPSDLDARLAAALCALQLRRVPEAEALLGGLSEDHPRVALLKGQLLLRSGEPERAVAILEPLMAEPGQLPPEGELDLRRSLAEAYLNLGRAGAAVAQLEGRGASDPRVALLLGQAYYQQGDSAAAATTLAPWLRSLPESSAPEGSFEERRLHAAIAMEYGRALITLGRGPDAVTVLQRSTALDSLAGQAWYLLGQALAAAGSPEAKAAFDRFQSLAEDDAEPVEATAQLEEELRDPTARNLRLARRWGVGGELEGALELVRREIALAPEDLRPRFLEFQLLLQAGRLEEAGRSAAETLVRSPDNADARYQQGALAMARGALASAEEHLLQTLALAPEHTAAMSDLAILLLSQDKTDEARELLERLLALRPSDERATAMLTRLEGK